MKGWDPSKYDTDEYIKAYVSNFKLIVNHYKDRVFTFESFNEPNNWNAP